MPQHERRLQWYTKNQDFAAIGSASQANMRMYSAIDEGRGDIKGATVTRMIIDIGLRSPTVAQLTRLFWGIVIVDTEARIAGGLPDADDMSDRHDWLIRGRLFNIQSDLSDSSQWTMRHYDIKTQRILRSEEHELLLVIDAGSDGFTMEWTAFTRALMRMP